MSDILHVFVSSTWLDLQPERKAVEAALQRMRETRLIGMEYFGSREETTRDVSLREVDRSHFYIGIFGGRYGSGITEAEYRRARENGNPCRIYFKDESTITDEQREKDAANLDELRALKAELRRSHTVAEFANPHDLAWKVTADLHDWLVETRGVKRTDLIPVDISRILKYAPENLIGREDETALLTSALTRVERHEKGRPHIVTFVAIGGEGKTSLVARWAAELAAQDWPGFDAAFAWSFYSQGTREQLAASSDLFLKEALVFFGDDADREFADSSAGAFEKGQRLARLVGRQRSLLILDGLEPLQYAPASPTPGQLKDQGIAALLKGLAANSLGLCIVTTRYSIHELRGVPAAPEVKLLRLSRDAGVRVLKALGVNGSERRTLFLRDGDESTEKVNEFEKLVEDVKGNALTLTIVGGFLSRAFHGDIRKRDRVKFEKADEKMDGGHAFRAMAAYEQWLLRDGGEEGRREVAVLRLMGLFDRPSDAGCLAALRREPITGLTEPLTGLADDDWEFCLSGLEAAKLLTVNRDASGMLVSLDAHPHLREYFARSLRTQHPDAWRAAHRRLYEHLCATTKEGDQPTLEDLQPLFQAVAHGCLAGSQQDACYKVYYARVLREQEFYSWKKLGALGSDLGAVACFFDEPWKRVSPALTEDSQAWLLSEAALRLRGVGRLTEALEPMRASLEMRVKQENWKNAAISASNLSELELTQGEMARAVGNAEKSVTYAERSGDAFEWTRSRGIHADALHQAGHRAEAKTRFREAEQMQQTSQPDYPLLYSLGGFLCCDLILSAPERAAWQQILSLDAQPPELTVSDSCRDASRRAAQTLKWAESGGQGSLLDVALNHLTLGRAAFYTAVPASAESGFGKTQWETARRELDRAVSGLRRSGMREHLPRGLLTCAWLRFLDGKLTGPESAQDDLDEAWEIAERGSMKLFMADIHLHRARLFFREATYPWESPQADLAAARALIERCGYGRRTEELQDAEAAILSK